MTPGCVTKPRGGRRSRTTLVVAFTLSGCGAISAAGGLATAGTSGCILADPPPELPKPPNRRPTIVTTELSPPADRPILSLDTEFAVPLELADPTLDYEWQAFVDYDPNYNPQFVQRQLVRGSVEAKERQTVTFRIASDSLVGPCHRVEFVVSLFRFVSSHIADSTGSDSVTWFYAPNGDVGACSTFAADAGLDAAFPLEDAGDARDAGAR